MGKNRDRVGLVAAILDAASEGANKTRIMFAANMSFKLLEKYLGTAMDLGFVQANGSSYGLTENGREFLFRYKRFHDKRSGVLKALMDLDGEREFLERLCQQKLVDVEICATRLKKQ